MNRNLLEGGVAAAAITRKGIFLYPELSHVVTAAIIAVSLPSYAGDFLLFPNSKKQLSAETMPYSQMLHTGIESDTFYLRGRFGVDFHFVGYHFGDDADIGINEDGIDTPNERGKSIFFGINATAHINMRPTSNMRFPVDNFYAVLALRVSGSIIPEFSWRLYPIYHLSAHLADGSPSPNDITERKVRPVSAEMARGEIYYKPTGELIEFGAGFGWYYHVCAQQNLVYMNDLSILLKSPSPYKIQYGELLPYALIRMENVRQGKDNFGVDASAGIIVRKENRGFGLSIRYFNRMHSGYYFEHYEKGFGAEYMFLY